VDARAALPPQPTVERQPSVPTVEQTLAAAWTPLPEATPAAVEEEASASAPAPLPTPEVSVREYVVEPGDSVRTIAREFGISNETIIWANDLTDPDHLTIGQTLRILPFTGLVHEVRPGDTVASVANGYEARVEEVIRANQLEAPYVIVVGQELVVPGGYRPLPQKPAPPATEPSAPADTVEAPDAGSQQAAVLPVRTLPVLGNTPQELFIASIGEAAVESHERTGIPASVTIAQAILESYWGSSRLAREASNYFGIKAQTRSGTAGVVWFDVWEVISGRNVMQRQPFRAYNSVAESFVDHGRFFLENPRYARALAARSDPRQFAREINRAGYATDPAYATKLIALMDRYDLYRFDA
jgi:flagellar protein FlgJ